MATKKAIKKAPEANQFPIVAIGASAGGLEALQQLFTHVPTNTGMSFVVIQHLSPDFKSLMVELLAKHTQIAVSQVENAVQIKPDHIYLMPPGKSVTLDKRRLFLADNRSVKGLKLPIDDFFTALARQEHELCMGVILSGTGSDGSRGIKIIKEEGGLVMIQEPASAKFDGMPMAALQLQLGDFVGTPKSIATELGRLGKAYQSDQVETELNQELLQEILYAVEGHTGVQFRFYRKPTIVRRTEKRMQIVGVNDLEEYLEFIHKHPEELTVLYKEFLIGVTRFYRDREAWGLIADKIIPKLFAGKDQFAQIRVWCVACSTGEEAYTIALLLKNYIQENNLKNDFKIFASDVDKAAINFASLGSYHEHVAADIEPAVLEANFERKSNRLIIRKDIRESIVFAQHDALSDPPFIHLDLVICRNFMIYLESEAQKRLLTKFSFALKKDGFLFLGPSESTSGMKETFKEEEERWKIYRCINQIKPLQLREEGPSGLKVSTRPTARSENKFAQTSPDQMRRRASEVISDYLIGEYCPTLIIANRKQDVIYIHGEVERYLSFPQRGITGLNLGDLVGDEESLIFRNGIRKAISENKQAFYKDIKFSKGNKTYDLSLTFVPIWLAPLDEKVVLVEFRQGLERSKDDVEYLEPEDFERERIDTLEAELREAKAEQQTLVEELETSNEELQASNEELLASNEELQSTNEELQSVNEELYTVNTELQVKISELTELNNDVNNLLRSTGIGTIFLDKEFRIRKFTPAITEHFNLVDSDLGRPINHFTTTLKYKNLDQDAADVLRTGKQLERQTENREGKPFLMRLLPYHSGDQNTEGIVITLHDISQLKEAENKLQRLNADLELQVSDRTRQLERSNAVMQEFAYSTTESLQKPLKRIRAYLDLVNGKDTTSPKSGPNWIEIFNEVKQSSQDAQRLIDDLREFAVVLLADTNHEPVHVGQVLEDVIDDLDFAFKEANAEIKADDMPVISGHYANVKQIFESIISRILLLPHGKRKLRVTVKAINSDKDKHVLQIKDNADPISSEADSVKRTPSDDYGIGLAAAERILNWYGGELTVSSTKGGNTHVITIPQAKTNHGK